MTDESREMNIDAFFGVGEPPAERLMSHFIGDECPPDGHRSEAIIADAQAALGLAEPEGAQMPAKRKTKPPEPELTPRERLTSLVYMSATSGRPHIVSRHTYEGGVHDVICICEASMFNLPRGCWAMQDARPIFDLPDQG